MAGARILNLRRGIAFAMVLVVHVVLLTIAAIESRGRYFQSPAQDFLTTWVIVPSDPTPRASRGPLPLQALSLPINEVQIEVPDLASVHIPTEEEGSAIDWTLEAQRSATAVSNAPRFREFGHIPATDPSEGTRHPQVTRHAGEAYRDSDGNHVAWVNDDCYVISDLPPLGTPDVFSRMKPTRTVCVDRSAAPATSAAHERRQ